MMDLGRLIGPLGICAYSMLVMAAASGLLIYKYHVKWIKLKVHIFFGIAALLVATSHAYLVLYLDR